jgi:type I restriction enzyme M protein
MEGKKMEQEAKNAELKLTNILRGTIAQENMQEFVVCCAYKSLYEKDEIKLSCNSFSSAENLYKIAKGIISNYQTETVKEVEQFLGGKTKQEIVVIIKSLILDSDPYFGYHISESVNGQISELALRLLDLKRGGDSVLDLGSGVGVFLLRALEYARENKIIYKDLFGCEINTDLVNLSNMIFSIVAEENCQPFTIPLNAVKDDIPHPYTKAFLYPPFGMKYLYDGSTEAKTRFSNVKFKSVNKSEWLFIDRLLGNNSGALQKAVAIVTAGALFNGADAEYRRMLANKGLIEGIIELPQGILYQDTSSKVSLLILGRNNKQIKLIDATSLQSISPKRFNKINLPIDEIINLYNSDKVETISSKELAEKPNWLPSNLAIKVKEVKNGIPLGDLAEIFTGSQYTSKNFEKMFSSKPTGYRILTSADIQDGTVNWNSLQSVNYTEVKFSRFAVQKNDVIVTSKSSKVKTAVVDIEPKENILVTGGMIIVRPNVDKLNPTYLKIFLDCDDGREALKSIQKGTIIVTLNSKDLKNVMIPVIDIEKQNEKAAKYSDKMSTLIAYKKEIEKIENSLKNFDLEEEDD